MKNSKPILLVEDDSVDVMKIQRAFRDRSLPNPLVNLVNGQAALDYLNEKSSQRPCLVLLDLSMPGLNGFEFLQRIKNDQRFKKIPVVVLTASEQERDVVKSFDLGAVGYIVKPDDYDKYVEILEIIDRYWTLNESPNGT
jgi:CheY-like chemotaxis protein